MFQGQLSSEDGPVEANTSFWCKLRVRVVGSKSTDWAHSSAEPEPKPVPATSRDSRWIRQEIRGNGSLSLARLCSNFKMLSEDLTDNEDIFNTCDELNDFLLNNLTDESENTV